MSFEALLIQYRRSPNSCAHRLQLAVWSEVKHALPHVVREIGNGRPLQSADMEDLGHDVFLKLMRRIDEGASIGDFRNYLFRATKNAVHDLLRGRARVAQLGVVESTARPLSRRAGPEPTARAIANEFRERLGADELAALESFLGTYRNCSTRKTRVNISQAVRDEATRRGRSKPLSRYHFLRSVKRALEAGGLCPSAILTVEQHLGVRLG